MTITATITRDEARERRLPGWNLRCNRCGNYGAKWLPGMRPGWGALALCPSDEAELWAEEERHQRAMRELTAVRFEQDRPPARRGPSEHE